MGLTRLTGFLDRFLMITTANFEWETNLNQEKNLSPTCSFVVVSTLLQNRSQFFINIHTRHSEQVLESPAAGRNLPLASSSS